MDGNSIVIPFPTVCIVVILYAVAMSPNSDEAASMDTCNAPSARTPPHTASAVSCLTWQT